MTVTNSHVIKDPCNYNVVCLTTEKVITLSQYFTL